MPKRSAGILFYRLRNNILEVFLVHPGGPFWARKDKAAWSIPKGGFEKGENPLEAAKREVYEETGIHLNSSLIDLGELKQPNRKIVHAWAANQECDPASIASNTFTMEWPPKSGKMQEFPEIDRAGWFSAKVAREKLHKGQVDFIDKLIEALGLAAEDSDDESGGDNQGPNNSNSSELSFVRSSCFALTGFPLQLHTGR